MTLIKRLRRVAKEATGESDARIEEQLKELTHRITRLEEAIADLKPNIKMLPAIVRKLYLDGVELPPPYDVRSQRFRYRSQNEEDGLLLALFKRIGTTNRRCVEIGCGSNGGNSGFLVQECGWTGLMVDANRASVATVKLRYAGHAVTVVKHRVTREDVNDLLTRHGFSGELDLLSLDIDGNDYWVWEALDACSPRVVVLEYNWLFGPERAVTVPYDAEFKVGAPGPEAIVARRLRRLRTWHGGKGIAWSPPSASMPSFCATTSRRTFPRSRWRTVTGRRTTWRARRTRSPRSRGRG